METGSDKFAITIHAPHAGSVRVDISLGGEAHSLCPSYIGDVFDGLVSAAAYLAERRSAPSDVAFFDWQDEPGSWRWRFEPQGEDVVLTIDVLRQNFAPRTTAGSPLLRWTVPSRRFCSSVLRAMDSIRDNQSLEQFREEWRGEYPSVKVERLRRALTAWK